MPCSLTTPLPGASPHPESLLRRMEVAAGELPEDYQPRTTHLLDSGTAKYTNRLFLEASPYLQQHAHNPVNWYPWGDEAFEEAERSGKPILLSVGYSTCHWCHVMEEESFEDEDIARVMNELFVPVKVDREERPDVDAVYMAAVMALTGHGGWPMTVFLKPDKKPFYGGTYFPPRDGVRGARVGFLTLLKELRRAYDEQRDKVEESARQIVSAVQNQLAPRPAGDLPTEAELDAAFRYYQRGYDEEHGGMGHAPKFPSSLPVRLLLRFHHRRDSESALSMATQTLRQMASGGMYDHVAGGFHRYSVDEKWLVPHFEKMLYDNAQLAIAYAEAHQVTGDDDFARVCTEILDYVVREMRSPEGGFYSATDADSPNPEKGGEREEGWYFTWTMDELKQILGEDDAGPVITYYNVTEQGNFEGRNILHTPVPMKDVAKNLGMEMGELQERLSRAKQLLYIARDKRPAPLRDEKILASWNGLMVSAFASCGYILDRTDYLAVAEHGALFITSHMMENGRLKRSYKDGVAYVNGYLEDYAAVMAALLDVFEVTGKPQWLDRALELWNVVEQHFADDDAGGFFTTSDEHESLLVREKPTYDGAMPTGNSLMAGGLMRLYGMTTETSYLKQVERIFAAFHDTLSKAPFSLADMLLAVDTYLAGSGQVVLACPTDAQDENVFLDILRRRFLPDHVKLVIRDQNREELEARLPLIKGKSPMKGKTVAYVCKEGACQLPTRDADEFERQLEQSIRQTP